MFFIILALTPFWFFTKQPNARKEDLFGRPSQGLYSSSYMTTKGLAETNVDRNCLEVNHELPSTLSPISDQLSDSQLNRNYHHITSVCNITITEDCFIGWAITTMADALYAVNIFGLLNRQLDMGWLIDQDILAVKESKLNDFFFHLCFLKSF